MSDSDPSFAALGSDDSDAASGSDSDADFAADAAAADAGSEDDEVLPVVLSQAELNFKAPPREKKNPKFPVRGYLVFGFCKPGRRKWGSCLLDRARLSDLLFEDLPQ
jgi:hypothetical protein